MNKKVKLKKLKTTYVARVNYFVHIFILTIFLMLLTILLNYISIILVKYHIFLHDFFGLAEMYITHADSHRHPLNSETEIHSRIFCELHRKQVTAQHLLIIGDYYKKSHVYTISNSFVWHNSQLPKSPRGFIWIYQI